MGDEPGQGGLGRLVFFLDENHCGNRHMIAAIEESGHVCERHSAHFQPGTEDIQWLPEIARREWILVTADARIRMNLLEKEAIRLNKVRMFYFSRNDSPGIEMGLALRKALPVMERIARTQRPPFTASINKSGQVVLRDIFPEGSG